MGSVYKQVVVMLAVVVVGLSLGVAFVPGVGAAMSRFGIAGPFAALGLIDAAAPGARAGDPAAGRAAGNGGGSGGRGPRLATVVVQPASVAILNDRVSALGTGIARQSVVVVPKSDGLLTEVLIASGTRVNAGDVIARLDAQAAEIALEKAKLAVEDARQTLERNRQLVQSNAAPASQVQAAELAARVAALNQRTAEQDLANRTILALISGVVGILAVTPGNEVTPQTVIATIEDSATILVNFWLPESFAGAVTVGDTAQLVPVARPQDTLQATVTAIGNQIDAGSGTFQVQAHVDNADGALQPGMAFTVSLQFRGDSFVAVDPLSVQWGAQGAYVWRVKDARVEKVAVRIVQRNTESVLVAGALAEGDAIVAEGLDGLKPGAEVKIFGAPDAEAPDAGAPDAGSPDAGSPDAGSDAAGKPRNAAGASAPVGN